MASILPSGGALRDVVFGGLAAVNPDFPVPAQSRARALPAAEAMRKLLPKDAFDRLRTTVSRVAEAGSADTSRWLAGAEYTAARAGFIMSAPVWTPWFWKAGPIVLLTWRELAVS